MPATPNNELNNRSSSIVLVVDDDVNIRNLITRWLTEEGYSCVQARDARQAWEHLQEYDVHLVTLDINMPESTGKELLPRIKKQHPDTEVLMLTASAETKTAIETLTHGASGYLLKPIEREELLFQVSKALERRQLIIENRAYTQLLEEKVREQTLAIRRAHEETIHRLVIASMHRDDETGAHIKRVGFYSELLADALGWPTFEVETIRLAAPMHDVGKIGIPDAILQKPGKLSCEEYEIMKTHAEVGAQMLAGSESPVLQMACEIALCHHERWDGGGYPRGLSASAIPPSARIVAIVDVYDALTHDRVYRPALPEEKVLAILREGRDTHFEADLLDVFLDLLPEVRRISKENPDDSLHEHFVQQVSDLLSSTETAMQISHTV